MTKKHFIDAAAIVKNIVDGNWTTEPPSWASARYGSVTDWSSSTDWDSNIPDGSYTRAVQTAEVFIMLFSSHNPRFDVNRFLIACGLMAQPAKVKR